MDDPQSVDLDGLDGNNRNSTNNRRRLGPDYTQEKVKCRTFLRMYKSTTRTSGTFIQCVIYIRSSVCVNIYIYIYVLI